MSKVALSCCIKLPEPTISARALFCWALMVLLAALGAALLGAGVLAVGVGVDAGAGAGVDVDVDAGVDVDVDVDEIGLACSAVFGWAGVLLAATAWATTWRNWSRLMGLLR